MSAKLLISDIARSAVRTDAHDPPSLVALMDALGELQGHDELPDGVGIDVIIGDAIEMLQRIVFREEPDAIAALEQVHGLIDRIQQLDEDAETGDDIATQPSAEELAIDLDLIEAWYECCAESLDAIESTCLSLADGKDKEEDAGEARRLIHTIKGECGVVSAHGLQVLFHEAESAIDRAIERGAGFPTDEILALVDSMRSTLDSVEPEAIGSVETDALLHQRLIDVGTNDAAPATNPETSDVQPASSGAGSETPEPTSNVNTTTAEAPAPADAATGPVEFPKDALNDPNLADFLCEAHEHLAGSERALLELETKPGDEELLNTVFRAFHTIKGVAGFMHLTAIVELAHVSETLLDAARRGEITLDSGRIDLVLKASDFLSRLMAMLEDGPVQSHADLAALIAALKHAVQHQGPLGDLAIGAPAPADTSAPPTATTADTPSTPEAKQPKTADKASSGSERSTRRDQTVKVSTTRMDTLVDMVGELVIAQQMVVQDPHVLALTDQRVQRNLTHAGKIIRDLQEVAMALRMVTLQGPFQKMSRLVRDVAKSSGKKINLVIEGEDTELDRNVVEELGDPLVHMIRNACDHGLEPADERIKAGKSPVGTLALRAYHRGGSIVIEVADDGRGLPRDKILAKAIERGLVPSDRDPADIPDEEVYNLIFLPGFSTAEKVTDLSGRGVGMDVVRRNIEALRGKCDIRSIPGQGSTFLMRLPLTLAIIDGMVVRVGNCRYVIPTLSIEQSFRPQAENVHTVDGGRGEMVSVRGTLLPIFRMSDVFQMHEGALDGDAHRKPEDSLLISLETNGTRICLHVDEILGQQQVVIKSLGQTLGKISGVSGGAILGDGRVALILDVASMIDQATATAA